MKRLGFQIITRPNVSFNNYREAYVTAKMVRNAYQGMGSKYETLLKAFDKDCANFMKRTGRAYSITQ